MYKDVLRSISDIDIFPVIAIVIFMIFFVGLFVYVFKLDKKQVSQMASMPLEDQIPVDPRTPTRQAQNS
ncbi:MAG: cbb3-type cytochrome c oxidase subunit 3 [Bacteroidota bacterium]